MSQSSPSTHRRAESWRNAGILTERGKEWKQSAVTRVILAPRNAGFVVYRGEMLLDDDGQPIKGDWVPLVEEEVWREACEAILGRRKKKARRTKTILGRVVRCGKCGSYMIRVKRDEFGKFSYTCRSKDSGGCASVSISGKPLDKLITDLAKAYLAEQRVKASTAEVTLFTGQQRLEEIGGKVAELMSAYNTGDLSGGVVFPQVKKLEDEQKELQAAKARHNGEVRRSTTIKGAWPEDDVDKQNAIMRELFTAIVIAPSGRPGLFEPERADVIWRED